MDVLLYFLITLILDFNIKSTKEILFSTFCYCESMHYHICEDFSIISINSILLVFVFQSLLISFVLDSRTLVFLVFDWITNWK